MIGDEKAKYFSLVIIGIFFVGFLYVTMEASRIVQKRQISTDDGIYSNRVSLSDDIKTKAYQLTKGCETDLCKTQRLLDSVTTIPYITNLFQSHSPSRTLELKEGDCDDKSNLLISMLYALDKEAYFVLVPKHIFVITPIEDKRLGETKGLWLDGKKYLILENTAKGSAVGFPLHYKLDEINVIVNPFTNEKHSFKQIEWR